MLQDSSVQRSPLPQVMAHVSPAAHCLPAQAAPMQSESAPNKQSASATLHRSQLVRSYSQLSKQGRSTSSPVPGGGRPRLAQLAEGTSSPSQASPGSASSLPHTVQPLVS